MVGEEVTDKPIKEKTLEELDADLHAMRTVCIDDYLFPSSKKYKEPDSGRRGNAWGELSRRVMSGERNAAEKTVRIFKERGIRSRVPAEDLNIVRKAYEMQGHCNLRWFIDTHPLVLSAGIVAGMYGAYKLGQVLLDYLAGN